MPKPSDSGDERRVRSSQPVKRGPPPLPTSMKNRKRSNQEKTSKRSRSQVVMWSVAGVGILLGLTLTTVFFLQTRRISKESPNVEPVTAHVSAGVSTESIHQPEVAPETPMENTSEELAVHESAESETLAEPQVEIASLPPAVAVDSATEPAPNDELDPDEATSLMGAKKGKEAITTLKRASNLFPKETRPDFYSGLINSGVGLNDLKAAEFHFNRVLDRLPGHLASLNNLALVEIKNRKIPAARNFFTLAAKQEPRASEIDQNLGRLLNQVRYFEIKGDDLKKMTALNTNSDQFHSKIGWMYMPFDQTERSLSEYKAFCREGKLEDTSCSRCGGKATLMCRTCSGRKTVVALGSNAETRDIGVNRSNVQTIVTPTSATLMCPTCEGNGRLDCTDCVDGRDPGLHH